MQYAADTTLSRFPKSGSVDVLFVTYGGGHCRMVIPVAHELEARGVSTSTLAMTLAVPEVKASGLPWFGFSDLPQAQDPDAIAWGERLAASFPKDGPVPFEESVAYMGVNYRDLERVVGPAGAAARFADKGRFTFDPEPTMKEVIELIRPKLVVATSSPRTEEAALNAAKTLGVPCLCMTDVFGVAHKPRFKRPGYGDVVTVLNDETRDILAQRGRPAGEVVVTGNPAFDRLLEPKVIAAGRAMKESRGWGRAGRKTILYASAPEQPTHPYTGEASDPTLPRQIEERLKAFVAQDEGTELVIRRHPSEDQNVSLAPRVSQSTMADDIDALMHAIDIVVVTVSTVAYQGYLVGRDVMSVECSVASQDAPYGEFGVSQPAYTLDEIPAVLQQVIDTPRQDTAGQKEPATKVVSDLIESMMRSSDPG